MQRSAFGLVVLVVLSGCSAAPAHPAGATSLAAPPATVGRIDGIVYDTEVNVLGGVRVSLSDHPTVAVTDGRGEFHLIDVAPGDHELRAERDGYRSSLVRVTVRAGEVINARLELEAIPRIVPYHELIPFKGHMTLGAATPVYAFRPGVDLEDQLTFDRNATTGALSLVSTLAWQATNALGAKRFQLDTILEGVIYNQTIGPSPMVNRVEPVDPATAPHFAYSIWLPRTCDYYILATCYANPPDSLVAVAVDQRFDLYSTVFYGAPAPENYTGLPD